MNILGIDYGQKRIGLAWVQGGLDIVLPFGVVHTQKWKKELVDIIQKQAIDKVVVGLPISQNGDRNNDNVRVVREFIQALHDATGVPVEDEDERFSSQLADAMGGDLPAGEAGASRDEKSAMAILQTYLDRT